MKTFDYSTLKMLREEKNLTQKEMSDRLKMTQANYSKLENGRKKIDSYLTVENIAKALGMPLGRLIGIMNHEENIQSSGIEASDLLQVDEILKEDPLREDEFVLLSAEVLNPERYDFKDKYSGLNLKNYDEEDAFPMWEYPPIMNIICSESVEIGFDYSKKTLRAVSVWLADKQIGILHDRYNELVNELIIHLMISRAVLIGNEFAIPGYFDTYMKVAFIATNAVCKSAEFKDGRFSTIKFLNQKEVDDFNAEPLVAKKKRKSTK